MGQWLLIFENLDWEMAGEEPSPVLPLNGKGEESRKTPSFFTLSLSESDTV